MYFYSQPLPEWEYNGNPDLVGYRLQYSKAGTKGGVLSHVIMDRLEREFTIEDLEEWTEYEVRVQAINGIGSGPWSPAVHGRTRESGEAESKMFLYNLAAGSSRLTLVFLAAVPSSGPANVSAFATTSSSILVRWGEVPPTDRNGLILGYKVSAASQGLPVGSPPKSTTNTTGCLPGGVQGKRLGRHSELLGGGGQHQPQRAADRSGQVRPLRDPGSGLHSNRRREEQLADHPGENLGRR